MATSLFQACTRARILLGPHKAQDLPFGFSHAYQAWGAGKHLASQRIRGACLSLELLTGLRHLVWSLLIQVLFFFPVRPAFHEMVSWHYAFSFLFFEAWTKEPSSSTVSCAENCSIFSLSTCAFLFLFIPCSCNCCLTCVRGGLLSRQRGDNEVCSYQIAALPDGFSQKCYKKPVLWKCASLCGCSLLPIFFHSGFLFFLIFLLLTWECPCCDIFDNSWLLRASQRIRSSEQFNCIYCLDYKCSVLLQSISEKAAFFFPVNCYSYLPARNSTKVLYLWYSNLSLPVFIGTVSFPAMAIN